MFINYQKIQAHSFCVLSYRFLFFSYRDIKVSNFRSYESTQYCKITFFNVVATKKFLVHVVDRKKNKISKSKLESKTLLSVDESKGTKLFIYTCQVGLFLVYKVKSGPIFRRPKFWVHEFCGLCFRSHTRQP